MPTELKLDLPLIDHHCHGVSPAELDYKGFQRCSASAILDRWSTEDSCTVKEADEIVRLIASENARRIYAVG